MLGQFNPEPREVDPRLADRSPPSERREVSQDRAARVRSQHGVELEARIEACHQVLMHHDGLQQQRVPRRKVEPVPPDHAEDVVDHGPDGDLPHRPAVVAGPKVLDISLQRRSVDVTTGNPELVEHVDFPIRILARVSE